MSREHNTRGGTDLSLFALVLLATACDSSGPSAIPDAGDGGMDAGDTDSDSESASDSDEPDASSPDLVPGWRLSWVRSFGGGSADVVHGSAAVGDATLVTGFIFGEDTLFGEGEPNETNLGDVGDQMYLARYAADGMLDWAVATKAGINGVETTGDALDATQDGVSVVGGTYWCYAIFGAGEPNQTELGEDNHDHTNLYHPYLAKYAADGGLLWVRGGRTPHEDEDPEGCPESETCQQFTYGAGLFEDGSALVSGYFHRKIVFGEGTPMEQPIVSAGNTDCFLAKYGTDGDLSWAKRIGGVGRDGCDNVRTSGDGTFYVAGHFEGTVVFGEGETGETALTAQDFTSAFLARLDGDGSLLWARDLGIDGDVNKRVGGIELLDDGNVAITGRYRGGMSAGDGEDGGVVETPDGGRGMFLAKFTPEGQRLWNRIALTTGATSTAWDVAELHDGSLVTVGIYSGDATFGMGEANEATLWYQDEAANSYIAMYDADGSFRWALDQGGSGSDLFMRAEAFYDEATGAEWFVVAGDVFENGAVYGTGGGDEIVIPDLGIAFLDVVILRFDREDSGQ